MEDPGGSSWPSALTRKLTGSLLFFLFPSATPKSGPSPDYLCWDDTLPDVWGHQRKAGADGGPHELSAMLGGPWDSTLSVLRACGPAWVGFPIFVSVVFRFVLLFVLCIFVNTNKFL